MGLLHAVRRMHPALGGRQLEAVHMQERVRRAFGSRGGDPVSAIGDEIVPVVIVDDLANRELASSGIRRYIVVMDSGVPVNVSYVNVINVDPKTKVRLDWFQAVQTATAAIFFRRGQGSLGTGLVNGAGFGLEPLGASINPAVAFGALQFFLQDSVLVPLTTTHVEMIAGGPAPPIPLGVVLGQGDRFEWSRGLGATATIVTLGYTEFSIDP